MIEDSTKLVIAKSQIAANINEEIVILNSNSGIYYGLNPIGKTVWELIQEPKTFAEVKNFVLNKYDVEPQKCQKELLSWLQQLQVEGLIEVSNETDI